MLDFENSEVKELAQFSIDCYSKKKSNLKYLKKRLQAMFGIYNREAKGIFPFIFGKTIIRNTRRSYIDYVNYAL